MRKGINIFYFSASVISINVSISVFLSFETFLRSLKMDEDESPIARRWRMNNESETRYRARQPSEAR